ncbi:response regulator [Ulvibacter litoralis]|nr:response regulator [Ulvibacter litoralis]
MKKFTTLLLIYFVCFTLSAQKSLSTEELLSSSEEEISEYFSKLADSSNNFYSKGNYKQSLEVNIDFLIKAFASENPYYIHQGYRLLGHNYEAINDTILAKESFEKSKKFAKLSENNQATAQSYMDLAGIFTTNNNPDKAFAYHDKSIELFEKLKDYEGLTKAHYNTILTAMKVDDSKKAYLHILKARRLNNFEKDSVISVGLDYYSGLYYAKKHKYDMAEKYLLKTIKGAEKAKLTVQLERAYDAYSQNLAKQGKNEEAAVAETLFEMYKHLNEENIKSLETEALSAKFQVSEYRKDVEAAELQNQLQAEIVKSKSNLNTILIVVTSCFLVMFIALFFAYRNRKKLVKELKVKNKEYLAAKEHSEMLSKTKSTFFSTVSHELRTPLYGVIGLSTILLEDKTLKKHEEDLKSLKFSADYLLALINDVLQINKIDSKTIEDEQTSFSIRDLFKKITASFEYMRLQNKNRIHIHISETIPKHVRGNSVRLSQILMNLIGNACKFTEDGDIYLIAETGSETEGKTTIKFYIKDTGIGIPKEKQETIFEEFSQANSINYHYQGTGLGLPIVKKLLALSDSEIHLESESGKGSLFSFELTFDIAENIVEKKEVSILDTSRLDGKSILIVEDNRINQTVTKKILENNNALCSIANNGEEAISKVKNNAYDLVLMDINMPLKNGMEATQEIRTFNKTIPIVALTAVEVEEMRFKIFDSGMNDIIVKPYDINKFIQTILKNIVTEKQEVSKTKDINTRLRAV